VYTSSNFIRVIRSRRGILGYVACMGEIGYAYKILVEKTEGKRPLGRRRRWWDDNIRNDLREVGWEVADWIHLA
jgi:hypothetical protein